MSKERLCPICNHLLDYDEVDIGVGVERGNYHCDYCGWIERETLNKLFGDED
jgi:transcription elongation factor Elf1